MTLKNLKSTIAENNKWAKNQAENFFNVAGRLTNLSPPKFASRVTAMLLCVFILLPPMITTALAQTSAPRNNTIPKSSQSVDVKTSSDLGQCQMDDLSAIPQPQDNGIVVGRAKLFNPDTLQSMLQDVERQLAALSFFNSTAINGAVGRTQGGRADSSSFSLNATVGSTPSVDTETVDQTGNNAMDSTKVTEKRAALTPQIPGTATPASLTGLSFGVAAQDILAEQTALSYQAINLRLLLDRAVSDRVQPRNNGRVRQQAVVGFQISLAPKPEYKNAVAVVEMTLDTNETKSSNTLDNFKKWLNCLSPKENPQLYKAVQKMVKDEEESLNKSSKNYFTQYSVSPQNLGPPSLVALLPQEKTYNVASITKDTKSIGFGAVVGLFGVGASGSKNKETFYLVKDIDTVALQKPAGKEQVSFGWHFQPVLGRKIVSPGIRQVYAALALPNGVNEDFVGNLRVKTYWRKWNRKTNAPGELLDVKSCANNPGCAQEVKDPQLMVYRNSLMDEMLAPQITDVDWEDAGAGQIRMKIEGANFTPETSIRIGPQIFSRQNGNLEGTAESRLLVLPGAALVTIGKDPLLVSRLGSRELRSRKANLRELEAGFRAENGQANCGGDEKQKCEKEHWGIRIKSATATAQNADTSLVELELVTRDSRKDLEQNRMLVRIGDKVFGLSDNPFLPEAQGETRAGDDNKLKIKFKAPTKLINDNGQLTVRRPFWGDGFAATTEIKTAPGEFFISNVSRLGPGTHQGTAAVAVRGSGFTDDIIVRVGADELTNGNRLVRKGTGLLLIYPLIKQLESSDQIVLMQGDKVRMFKLSEPQRTPEFKKAVASIGDTVTKIQGSNLDIIREIRYFGTTLPVVKNGDGSIMLHIPTEATETKGVKAFEVILQDNSRVNLTVTVQP
ncbi:MAG TPA: hypothetical protein VGB02_16170 [Pyrinomonadaceae bacterium]|jgi:hypothetical protein